MVFYIGDPYQTINTIIDYVFAEALARGVFLGLIFHVMENNRQSLKFEEERRHFRYKNLSFNTNSIRA
jgi:hypothetical protein